MNEELLVCSIEPLYRGKRQLSPRTSVFTRLEWREYIMHKNYFQNGDRHPAYLMRVFTVTLQVAGTVHTQRLHYQSGINK